MLQPFKNREESIETTSSCEVAVTGYSVRAPGSNSPEEFWNILRGERCVVSEVQPERWSTGRFFHPEPNAAGTSYTTAAGQLERVWDFDPGFFGISPREAEQMDPQQRILLEVTWEAVEAAGLPAGTWDKDRTGVYVGASSSDYSTHFIGNAGAIDAQFMLGNTLSILSNRISYLLDINGPSYTVDTACSSSFYALDQAMRALNAGEIDTAIVGGVNVLLSPMPFIGFSRAAMLSPDGLCKAFDATANGYVRSEGAVVFVLRRLDAALQSGDRIRGVVMASGVNSNGRTVGMSMPSSHRQADLLRNILTKTPFDPNDLAFIEAHGTGTSVGDPLEAEAIGTVFGAARRNPLPIGSAKSNFGHLEPVSGLIGLLKAQLSLENGLFPKTLHVQDLNPDIPFDDLNLSVARTHIPIEKRSRPWIAGVNSFGFGGANAHVLLRQPSQHEVSAKPDIAPKISALMLTAASSAALSALARRWSDCLNKSDVIEGALKINGANHRRHRHVHRLVALGNGKQAMTDALEGFLANNSSLQWVKGQCRGSHTKIAFAFSGNGSQWPGMGRRLFEADSVFRNHFKTISGLFGNECDLDLEALLHEPELEKLLCRSEVAQPLLFSVQSALVEALAAVGLKPHAVVGHSVGEVAAAWACGALTLEDAVHVVRSRSMALGELNGLGGMAAVLTGAKALTAALDEFGDHSLTISAENSPRSCTLSGPNDELEQFSDFARKRRIPAKRLEIGYPYHSAAVDVVRERLYEDLEGLTPRKGHATFYSSTDGKVVEGDQLGADYFWRNTRCLVQFRAAIDGLLGDDIGVIVEIGPRPILRNYIQDTVDAAGMSTAVMCSLDQGAGEDKTALQIAAEAMSLGGEIDDAVLFGPKQPFAGDLPSYPWQHQAYRAAPKPQNIEVFGQNTDHPLLGARLRSGEGAWHSQIDPVKLPWLADHVVDGQVVLPAAGFLEIALSAGRIELQHDALEVSEFEILRPVVFDNTGSVEIRTTFETTSNAVKIESRKIGDSEEWHLCAIGKVRRDTESALSGLIVEDDDTEQTSSVDLYDRLNRFRLGYGPAFRRVSKISTNGRVAWISLNASTLDSTPFQLDPTMLDASMHGLFRLIELHAEEGLPNGQGFLPIRLGRLRVLSAAARPSTALLILKSLSKFGVEADISLFDSNGAPIAEISELRLKAVQFVQSKYSALPLWRQRLVQLARDDAAIKLPEVWSDPAAHLLSTGIGADVTPEPDDGALLLDAAAHRLCWNLAERFSDAQREIKPEALTKLGKAGARLFYRALDALAEAHAVTFNDEGCSARLFEKCPFPEVDELLQVMALETPGRSAELHDLLKLECHLEKILDGDQIDKSVPLKSVDFSLSTRALWNKAVDIVSDLAGSWSETKRLNILAIGIVPQGFIDAVSGLRSLDTLILSDIETRGVEILRKTCEISGKAVVSDLDTALNDRNYDVVLHVDVLLRATVENLQKISSGLVDGGCLIGVERQPDLFTDLVMGKNEEWWCANTVAPEAPIGRILPASDHLRILSGLGLKHGTCVPLNTSAVAASVFFAVSDRVREDRKPDTHSFRIAGHSEFSEELSDALLACGHSVTDDAPNIVYLAGSSAGDDLATAIADAAALNGIMGTPPEQLWIVTRGAAGPSPAHAAALGLGRVIGNEYPETIVRIVDFSSDMPLGACAENFVSSLVLNDREHEIFWNGTAARAPRLEQVRDVEMLAGDIDAGEQSKRTLEIGQLGNLDTLKWQSTSRRPPVRAEIEIAVVAAGLNFRDVMWAQGMLPVEALEDGFAGATLGMECSGVVTRRGGDSRFQIGDRVIAFAPSCFASHVTVSDAMVAELPQGLDAELAASVPTTFITAQYALVETARLKKGETVLIHGGAGGVGLAALQVAKRVGARVLATAGSPEKRRLLTVLGVDEAFDSRSLRFADDVMHHTDGQGVDVVLNSLSGEAMERSIGCLKPFGRFVELGKRDFFQNSSVGLRPFRHNLSYFGVDADQLLNQRPELTEKLFNEVSDGFATGALSVPPCQVFEAGEVVDAFRLMQKSGHIGKILIRAPKVPDVSRLSAAPEISDGAWLLIGGLGGFGLSTVRWLADQGVEKLWLTGRSGKLSDENRAELEKTGVQVEALSVDAADFEQMSALIETIKDDDVPLKGVIHAAMELDDGIFANQTPERMAAVMRPKIAGAYNLDLLVRDVPLDHFIVYSSVTTLFGNPGQAAYVAANSYIESLVKSRRAEGLPGLAIAWGPISDQGYLAREDDARNFLEKRLGGGMSTASEALEGLRMILASGAADPVISFAPVKWGALVKDLPLLSTALFSLVDLDVAKFGSDAALDLRSLIEGMDEAAALQKIVSLLVEETATILRQPSSEIDPLQPLTEMGFDSLMAVNLRMAAEENLGVDLPLMALVEGMTLAQLGRRLLGSVADEASGNDLQTDLTIMQHVGAGQEIDQRLVELAKKKATTVTSLGQGSS